MNDYHDRFELATDAVATPERWARAMFGDVPSPGERFIWQSILHLRLSRHASPDTVAGWRVAGRDDDEIRLVAASWFLNAALVVRVVDGRVSLDTFVHYDRLVARGVWPACAPVHRALVPGVLRNAARRVMAGSRA
ncbi:hypothetical protein AB0M20_17285 [Actinoplanes sp. NPDC051633]|uniref:hypothetical protein n=1 Tax=Actinoplanes sp. NPDC051633 TaxID=3155670 RepID=UPI003426625D